MSESSDGVKLVFSQNLKMYLEAHKYSLKEFSQKLGVPISTVHGWINGVPPKNVMIIKKISNFLDVSVEDLCFESHQKKELVESDLVMCIGNEKFKIIFKKIR